MTAFIEGRLFGNGSQHLVIKPLINFGQHLSISGRSPAHTQTGTSEQ